MINGRAKHVNKTEPSVTSGYDSKVVFESEGHRDLIVIVQLKN